MENLSLMERFADPDLFTHLTIGEKVSASLVTTLMGMGITFVVLTLIWGMIVIMGKILVGSEKKDTTSITPEKAISNVDASQTNNAIEISSNDDQEIVAVIIAAISASTGIEATKLHIKKINRMSQGLTSWSKAGSSDCIQSRF